MWEFFDECVQDLDIPKMWENLSYSNDLHPSFGIHGLQIFIAHKDKSRREWSEMPRFYVVLEDLDNDIFEEKFQCEDWDDLLDFVANYRGEKKMVDQKFIEFEFNGVMISNPFMSECGRFEVDPKEYYGIDIKEVSENV